MLPKNVCTDFTVSQNILSRFNFGARAWHNLQPLTQTTFNRALVNTDKNKQTAVGAPSTVFRPCFTLQFRWSGNFW